MAKSIRSKVKKRLRSVKRAVVKQQRHEPHTKLNKTIAQKAEHLKAAATGYLPPPKPLRSAFRYDDESATFAQHNWRQGPDYRSASIGADAGYAVVRAKRPKSAGDAPTAAIDHPPPPTVADAGVMRLVQGTEQIVPKGVTKKARRKLKAAAGGDRAGKFRWI